MRTSGRTLALAVLGVLALLCAPVSAQPYPQERAGSQMDVSIFYDGLSSYGEWVEMPDYGWSWAPRVERDWRPYTRGQWLMTDDGWYWDSDEQFGWAAYHYGRWVNDRYYGWVWIPGTEWAPAWVSWRHGNGYTGWAPLPPRATWRSHVGLSIAGLEIDAFIGADDYSFVQDRSFVDRGVYQRVLPPTQNVTIINVTTNVTNYGYANDRVYSGGIAIANVERAVGRRVPRARTVDLDRANGPRRAGPDEVAVYRPQLRAAPAKRPAQGRSLVKGEQPSPLFVERRQQRERELKQTNRQPEVTAKAVDERRGGGPRAIKGQKAVGQPQVPRPAATTNQQEQRADREKQTNTRQQQQQQQRDQANRNVEAQRAKDQQQRVDREKQTNARQQQQQQQRDQATRNVEAQRAKGQQQQADREKQTNARQQQQQQQRDQANRNVEAQRAKDQQQRVNREKQTNAPQQQRPEARTQREAAPPAQREQPKAAGPDRQQPQPKAGRGGKAAQPPASAPDRGRKKEKDGQ